MYSAIKIEVQDAPPPDPETKSDLTDNVRTIQVLPSDAWSSNAEQQLHSLNLFLEAKHGEYEKFVLDKSASIFTASYLQSHAVCWEFAQELAKVYGEFGAQTTTEFNETLRRLKNSPQTSEQTRKLIEDYEERVLKWDMFLKRIDRELAVAVGPKSLDQLIAVDSIENSPQQSNTFLHNSLANFMKESRYQLTLLAVIPSFAEVEASDHTVKTMERLGEFQEAGCDILLLTKNDSTTTGYGFMKIAGMPCLQLVGEQEALDRLLQNRQPASSLAGSHTLHVYAELLCSGAAPTQQDQSSGSLNEIFDSTQLFYGGTVLADKGGNILDMHIGCDPHDWPDVDTLLQKVRFHTNKNDTKDAANDNAESLQQTTAPVIEITPVVRSDVAVSIAKNRKRGNCCSVI